MSIDHLPTQNPAKSLLEMCYHQLLGGEPPLRRNELVNQLVNEMYAFTDKLPLIVIDVPANDLAVLDVALRDTHTSLERLNAVIVLICDTTQRNQLPSTVVSGFERFQLNPFSAGEIVELVEQRLASVGHHEYRFTLQLANQLLEKCDGYPLSVMTKLRDEVDKVRMQHTNSLPLPFTDTSARIHPRDVDVSLAALKQSTTPHLDAHRLFPNDDDLTSDSDVVSASPSNTEIEVEAAQDTESDIIDADLPWQQRIDPFLPQGADSKATEDVVELFGFDLDMEALNTAKNQDEPLQPLPFSTPILDASVETPTQTMVTGMFRGIAQRNKDSMKTSSVQQDDGEDENETHRLQGQSESASWWGEESSLPQPRKQHTITEAESAAMLHDEIGFILADELLEDEDSASEKDILPFEGDIHDADVQMHVTQQSLLSLGTAHSSAGTNDTSILSMLEAILVQLQGQKGEGLTSQQGLMDFFRSRTPTDRYGPKVSFPLNTQALRTLNLVDAYVVSTAHARDFSPSDKQILQHLAIKRSRLSQICNRLLKDGILQARTVGKSRKYSLTQAARAQLVAWGGLKEGDA